MTPDEVLLALREQNYVPRLTHQQAKALAALYGTEYKPAFWQPTVALAEIAALIATHINSTGTENKK